MRIPVVVTVSRETHMQRYSVIEVEPEFWLVEVEHWDILSDAPPAYEHRLLWTHVYADLIHALQGMREAGWLYDSHEVREHADMLLAIIDKEGIS